MNIKFLYLFLITIALNIEILCAQEFNNEGFADFLFKKGEYYRAITEYYRLLHICTDSTKKVKLFSNIGLCYFHGADYEGYVSFLKKNEIHFQSNSKIRAEMDLYLGKSFYCLNQYPKVISTLERSNVSANNLFYDETQFLLGISYARIFDWQTAIKKMQLIKQDTPQKIFAENISRSLKNFSKLPKKSPFWAGTLSSIIPGAGYFYCNRKGTGLTSLIVNGLLIWTVRDAIIKKQYGLATAVSFLGIGWYIGNIKGSIDAADIYNTNIRNEFIDYLLKKENINEYLKIN
jgi:tetratricopeptide (TPR) repeat protein